MVKGKIKEEGRVARLIFIIILIIFNLLILYPIINVISVSLSSYSSYIKNPMMIFPSNFSLDAYKTVFQYPPILSGYRTTLIVTFLGTILGVFVTLLTSYPLSKQGFRGKKIFMYFILFTMFFNGGMIPAYFNMSNLNLLDTLGALILPSCISAYNVILMKNFMENLPPSLIEAAVIDGASEPQILFKIVMPLSKAIVSVIILFIAVGYWNNYFSAVIYIQSSSKWPLQLVLRELIMSATVLQQQTGGNLAESGGAKTPTIMLQYAAIVIAMVPVLIVYPFIQKYFENGVMIGAIKG